MDEKKLRVFDAIASFVQDLDTGFGKRYKPAALYNRLTVRTTPQDTTAIERHINAFRVFFNQNQNYIRTKELATNARIVYSERIYLDVGRILSKTDTTAHKHIHQHLVTIYSLMNLGTREGVQALETIKTKAPELDLNLPDTTEGKFIHDTLTEMTSHFENMEDNDNPMAVMSSMMQSGFFTKFMGDLQTKFSDGDMNLGTLMSTVTSVISEATPEAGEEADQIRTFVTQSMTQVNALTGGQNLPPEVQGEMDNLLNAVTGGQRAEVVDQHAPVVDESLTITEGDESVSVTETVEVGTVTRAVECIIPDGAEFTIAETDESLTITDTVEDGTVKRSDVKPTIQDTMDKLHMWKSADGTVMTADVEYTIFEPADESLSVTKSENVKPQT